MTPISGADIRAGMLVSYRDLPEQRQWRGPFRVAGVAGPVVRLLEGGRIRERQASIKSAMRVWGVWL